MYYLKLYYKLLDWEWYTNANVMRLFIHCLLKANRQTKKWQGITIERGSFITSYNHLAIELNLSTQQVRTALDKLESTGEITRRITRNQQGSNTMIIVKNYNEYQPSNTQDNTQITLKQHSNNTQITTTRECNNDIECKNDNTHINACVCELTESDKKVLRKYAKQSKAYNIDAYIYSLIKSGSYKDIINEHNQKEKIKKNNVIKMPELKEPPEVTEQAYLKFKQQFTNRRSNNDTMAKSIGNVEN